MMRSILLAAALAPGSGALPEDIRGGQADIFKTMMSMSAKFVPHAAKPEASLLRKSAAVATRQAPVETPASTLPVSPLLTANHDLQRMSDEEDMSSVSDWASTTDQRKAVAAAAAAVPVEASSGDSAEELKAKQSGWAGFGKA